MKQIKVKGRCPVCGSKMIWGSWMCANEPWIETFLPVCINHNCELFGGYGSNIKYRFINHRTVKIEGLWD